MEVSSILAIEFHISSHIVIPTDKDLGFEICIYQPADGLLKFGHAALISEVAGMDEYVSSRQLGGLIMGIRNADYSNTSGSHSPYTMCSSKDTVL
jgi:hypothetical protein